MITVFTTTHSLYWTKGREYSEKNCKINANISLLFNYLLLMKINR